jgi:hypothetical protein
VATSGGAHQLYPLMWEADKSWYNPSLHNANFVIQAPAPPSLSPSTPSSSGTAKPGLKSVLYTFGQPARSYWVDGMTVLVWDYNLLTRTGWGQSWPVFDFSG